jgi:Putative sensor
MSTTRSTTTLTHPRTGLLDPATYVTSAHLITDLVVGTATFSIMVTLLALSSSLMITLVGIPLLAATLLAARGIAALERRRAGTTRSAAPPTTRGAAGLRDRLTDPEDWRAVLYALLLFPTGILTGTITLAGWATAAAAITSPLYVGRVGDSQTHLGNINLHSPGVITGTVVVGVGLMCLMPVIVRTLARLDAVLVQRLLDPTARNLPGPPRTAT